MTELVTATLKLEDMCYRHIKQIVAAVAMHIPDWIIASRMKQATLWRHFKTSSWHLHSLLVWDMMVFCKFYIQIWRSTATSYMDLNILDWRYPEGYAAYHEFVWAGVREFCSNFFYSTNSLNHAILLVIWFPIIWLWSSSTIHDFWFSKTWVCVAHTYISLRDSNTAGIGVVGILLTTIILF